MTLRLSIALASLLSFSAQASAQGEVPPAGPAESDDAAASEAAAWDAAADPDAPVESARAQDPDAATAPTRAPNPGDAAEPEDGPTRQPLSGLDFFSVPDVVQTRDGGLLRGTIRGSASGAEVTIVLPGGEVRTVARADVRYAGPEADRPGSSASPDGAATAPSPPLNIHVVADDPDVRLYRLVGIQTQHFTIRLGDRTESGSRDYADFEPLCDVPCRPELQAGRHQLGVSRGNSNPERAAPVDLTADATLRVRHVDNTAWRVIGWILVSVGVGSAGFLTWGLASTDLEPAVAVSISAGGGLALALLGLGGVFAADGAEIRVE